MHYSKPFTKLFSSIITSSIWNENDKVRVVWITLLALSDANGFVSASVGGLAHAARVSKEDCEAALGYLFAPDDDSRSKEFDGQRVELIDGGFLILNYKKYRDLGRKIDRDEYLADKQWESRQKKKGRQQTSTFEDKASTNASASASVSACTKEEAEKFCVELGLPSSDGEAMFLHWQEKKFPKNWKLTIQKWKSFGYLPSQKQSKSGRVVRSMSAFEIEKRVTAITAEINSKFKAQGGRVVGDGIDELKQRRDELQKSLLA